MSGWPVLGPLPTQGKTVRYHGSIALSHGVYIVDDRCDCDECFSHGAPDRLVLVPAREDGTRTDGMGLVHVRPESITPLTTEGA